MSERLVIRLESEANQKIDWLVWSDSENEIIASGEIENAEKLALLQSQADQRLVICLLPSVDVSIKPVVIEGNFNRQLQQALPYLVEDDLAGDVEQLHFSVFDKKKDLIHVALCAESKMRMWLSWLNDANIVCRQFIPESLALPFSDDEWHALKMNDYWLVRENKCTAWGCDADMLPLILESKIDSLNLSNETDNEYAENNNEGDDERAPNAQPVIISYSEVNETYLGNWRNPKAILAMEVLAKGTIGNTINILSGEFKPKKESNPQLERWHKVVIAAIVLFVFSIFNIYMQAAKYENQTLIVKAQVEDIYQQAFPNSRALKYARIKKKIKTLVKEAGQNEHEDFIIFINEIAPLFSKSKDLKMLSVKYKRSRGELSILAEGKNFRSFEIFSEKLPKEFSLSQGALSNHSNAVSGLLTIRKQ